MLLEILYVQERAGDKLRQMHSRDADAEDKCQCSVKRFLEAVKPAYRDAPVTSHPLIRRRGKY